MQAGLRLYRASTDLKGKDFFDFMVMAARHGGNGLPAFQHGFKFGFALAC